jgi:formylglycine-generating enzyme required for sulfatase activity
VRTFLLLLAGCQGVLWVDASVSSIDAGRDVDAGRMIDAGADAGRTIDGAHDAGPPPPCPTGTVEFDGVFCMDVYEAPNEAGTPPLAMQSALAGEEWCAERGKRLCTEAEWVRACRGSCDCEFPYGDTYERGRCNDDETWISPNWTTLGRWPSQAAMDEAARLYQAEPSGSNEGCVSEDGVYDLAGNVAEWVRRSFPHTNNYDHVMKGCYWAGCYGGAPPSCSFVNPAHPSGFRSYEAGFRCCLDI